MRCVGTTYVGTSLVSRYMLRSQCKLSRSRPGRVSRFKLR